MITVNVLKPRCNADNEAVVVVDLFLTETHELCLKGYCSKCLKNIFLTIPLTELWDKCPCTATPEELEAERLRLHALSVKPDDPKLLS